MGNSIDQFMWAYQQHFRTRVEIRIRGALSQIGFSVDVRAVLVGFALDKNLRHQICIEPEVGPLCINNLDAVRTRSRELFEAHPEYNLRISDPRSQKLHREGLLRRSRGDALVESIESAGVFEGLTFFASVSSPIGGYEVHTCVGIPTVALNSLPALDDPVIDGTYLGRSLTHEVIVESLKRADRALYLPDPGTGPFDDIGTADDIIKTASARLADGAAFLAIGQPCDLFSSVNEFASLSYERGGAAGRLTLTPVGSVGDRLKVQFQRPVPLRQARSIRKLLELSDDSSPLLIDNQGAYGLGYSSSGTDRVEITINGHAEWELRVDDSPLVRVNNGKAALPVPLIEFDEFRDTAERILGTVELSRLWAIIQESQTSGHGMALVISRDPQMEADRLGGQAVSIRPALLDPADIARLGRVDGAILLGPDGRCYAFGVILDGEASGHGDPARGSRFNSAIRYQRTKGEGSIVIVISDDGTVDLIPSLRPRVRREHVKEAVRAFVACCQAEPVDGGEFGRMYDLVKSFAFYLDYEQCRVVNELYVSEMNRRVEAGKTGLFVTPLQPDPDMDESYFLEGIAEQASGNV